MIQPFFFRLPFHFVFFILFLLFDVVFVVLFGRLIQKRDEIALVLLSVSGSRHHCLPGISAFLYPNPFIFPPQVLPTPAPSSRNPLLIVYVLNFSVSPVSGKSV